MRLRRRTPLERFSKAVERLPDEQRAALFQDTSRIPTWNQVSGGPTYSSVNVTLESATGLPAVGAAVRLLSETISQLPLNVYKGRGADKLLADATWQYRLLAELPGMGDFTPFDLVSDIVACLELGGNAFLQKVKAAGEVVALIVIDPARVRVLRENGEKLFKVRNANGHEDTYTTGTIVHIRGFTLNGSDVGVSPITQHRQKLGSIIAQDQYQGRFYGQGTLNGIGIKVPGKLNEQQAERLLEGWRGQMGVENAHLPLVLQEGADFARLGMTLQDSQFVEGAKLNLIEVANIFRIPASFLGAFVESKAQTFEQDNLRFYTMGIAPRLKRIELALFTDPDLFPQRQIYPEFDVKPLLRTDAKTRAEVQHYQIQDGSRLVDEIRADDGLPPLPAVPADPTKEPGKVPQVTPVGGAPNPNPNPPADKPVEPQQATFHLHNEPPVVHNHFASPDVNVTTPDVRVEPRITVEAAPTPDVHVAPADVRIESPITVEAARAPDVHVPVTVEAAKTPDVHIEPAQVTVEPAEVRVEPRINIEAAPTPDIRVEPQFTVEPANVTVETPDIHVSPPVVNVEVKGQRTKRTVTFSDGREASVVDEPEDA